MRILSISTFYPPFTIGGAEICARNLNLWLTENGHEVAVIAAAPTDADSCWNAEFEGYRLYRVNVPRVYTVFEAANTPEWKKPLWHLQDILDPRNKIIFRRIIDEFEPDLIHVHWIQGLGYNALEVFGERDIPTAITLHDLSLACVRTTMFRNGHDCTSLCMDCRYSIRKKQHHLNRIPRLGLISPSRANMATIEKLIDVSHAKKFHILNPNIYPKPTTTHMPGKTLRFAYAGRLEETKGINLLLEILDKMAGDFDFHLTAMGTGPEEENLRNRYGAASWLTLTGQVSMQHVSDVMASSDLLLVPSLWLENSPGVVFQAMGVALPVMGSDKGGLPELITHGVNGILVEPGNQEAWTRAISAILDAPDQLVSMRKNASKGIMDFDYDALAQKIVGAFEQIIG